MSIWTYLPRWWVGAIANGLFVVLIIIGIILIRTFIPQTPPIKPIIGEYSVAKGDDSYIVYYRCQSEVMEEFEAHVHRTITHTVTGESLSLPATEVKFDIGTHPITRVFYVPKVIAPGKWCATAIMEWRPFLSLVDHKAIGKPQCFEIPK